MAKKPKHPPAPPQASWKVVRGIHHVAGVYKRNPISSTAALLAIFVSMSALGWLAGIENYFEPVWYASRAYARELVKNAVDPLNSVGEKNQKILYSIQLDNAVGKREAADNSVKQWQYEASKATTEQLKNLANESLRSAQATSTALTNQIKALCQATGQTTGVCQ